MSQDNIREGKSLGLIASSLESDANIQFMVVPVFHILKARKRPGTVCGEIGTSPGLIAFVVHRARGHVAYFEKLHPIDNLGDLDCHGIASVCVEVWPCLLKRNSRHKIHHYEPALFLWPVGVQPEQGENPMDRGNWESMDCSEALSFTLAFGDRAIAFQNEALRDSHNLVTASLV